MTNEIIEGVWKIINENKFQIIDEINNELICSICKKLMIKACNSHCGCRYCSDCIENYLDHTDKFCPGNKKFCEMKMINYKNDVFIDNPVNAKISEIVVKCPYKNCNFTDELSLIDNHLRICNYNPKCCPYFEFGCKNDQIMNNEMKDHLCTEIYCHTKLLLDFINNLRNEMESMNNEIVELKSMNIHLNKKLETKIESKNTPMSIEDFEKITKNNVSEIEILNKEIGELKIENKSLMNKLEKIEKSRESEIYQLEQKKLDNQNNDEDIVKSKIIENNTVKKEYSKRKSMSHHESIKSFQTKTNNIQQRKTEGKIHMEHKWEILNFSHKDELKDIYSKPFYSHNGGYKMCLSLRITGNFIDVYFHLLKGEFDDDLTWPMQDKITIEITNQLNKKAFTTRTIDSDNKQNDQKWNKPAIANNEGIYFFRVTKEKEIIQNDKMEIICKINF